ncbi:hypothetical protein GE061_014537 [Apolygus lucorum]|uniref:Uncharacterized protein n=1 Tax=Apolygus lucorum TaxID=248454 RepID=A0A8S9XIJ4_APOLU|nr:hypothetical protein GE061_014537 [Apolygus lucorum]
MFRGGNLPAITFYQSSATCLFRMLENDISISSNLVFYPVISIRGNFFIDCLPSPFFLKDRRSLWVPFLVRSSSVDRETPFRVTTITCFERSCTKTPYPD